MFIWRTFSKLLKTWSEYFLTQVILYFYIYFSIQLSVDIEIYMHMYIYEK